jgi:GDP-L-fucose synthase
MDTIICTGLNGFLGRHLEKYLQEKFYVVSITRNKCDLRNFNALKNNFSDHGNVKYIFHLANSTFAGDWALTHKGEQFLDNNIMHMNMLRLWKESYADAKFITFGTSCGYDPLIEDKTEDRYLDGKPDKDLFVYAMSKRNLLIGLESLNHQYGMNYNYFIPNTLYGSEFEINDSHFIFDIIKKCYNSKINNTECLLWGSGDQKRELVYVDDACKIIMDNLHRNNERINICTGNEYTIKMYAKIICNIIDYDFDKIKFDIDAFEGVKSKVLIPREDIYKDFKYTSITDGIKNTIDYYINKIK